MKNILPFYIIFIILILGSCTFGENESNPKNSLPENVFTDPRDGNVYKTVKIGGQKWFAENLRYSGDIPQVVSQQAWASIKFDQDLLIGQQAAWSYYENDPKNDSLYGKLYNWHAVRSNKICPSGWHIPTGYDWYVLREFLGGYEEAENKMKTTSGWKIINNNSTNSSGFTARPSGVRTSEGVFKDLGERTIWWNYFSRNSQFVGGFSLSNSEVGLLTK